jgi:hypothetical protein
MNLKQLINKSIYGTIGYISSQDDLNLLEQYILYNLPVLREFKQIVVAINYKNYPDLTEENTTLWKKYFPDCILLDSKINRGHTIGTADLDNMVFDYCKENNKEWLCKSANDVILNKNILNKEIEEADFYYLGGIGFSGLNDYNFNFEKIFEDVFYPQTNFYFINVNKTDYLNNKHGLDNAYVLTQTTPNYNGRIFDYIEGFCCEQILRQCVKRNNLITFHLLSKEKYFTLLEAIKQYNIHDGSHKNIMIEDICHFHFPKQSILEIN